MSFLSKFFRRAQDQKDDMELAETLNRMLNTPPDEEALRNAGMSEEMIAREMKFRKILEESKQIEKGKRTTAK